MSGFGSDAITTTLSVAGQPQLITEYMPGDDGALVINTAASGTVLLGTSSSINPNTAVPLPAGAAVLWTEPGQLWAYLGPDGTAAVTLVVTDRASSWQPSPEAVGVAVAAQLLATGVPSVLLQDVIYEQFVNAGGNTGFIPVSQYASLLVGIAGAGAAITVYFYDTFGNQIYHQDINQADGLVVLDSSLAINISISAFPGAGVYLLVEGSNRVVSRKVDARGTNPGLPSTFNPNQAWTGDIVIGSTTHQGMCYVSISVSNTPVGLFFTVDTHGNQVRIVDTTQLVGGMFQGMIALGIGTKTVHYAARSNTTNQFIISITPCDI